MFNSYLIAALMLIINTITVCMDTSKTPQQFFMFIPKKQPNQPCIIPLEHAKQCQPITDMFENISQETQMPHWPIENVSGRDILNFVFYLEDIYNINQLQKDDTEGQQPFHNRIAKQIKSLTTPELINLFTIVDVMEVIDKNNNHWIVNEVTSRLLANLDQASVFQNLDGRPLFREVVQNISKQINFEQKYIQPYANTLTQRQELERTVSPLTAAWYNVSNALTAPVRWFCSPSWATKIIMRPYYLNNQTGTMITGFVQKRDPKDKIARLLITNKKTNQNQIISLDSKNINNIQQIEASTKETVFICRTKRSKPIIINTLNKENPILEHDFTDCVFSENDNKLYAIKKKEFGIFDIKNNTFEPITKLTYKIYVDIKMSKNKKNLMLCYRRITGVDEDEFDKHIDEVWIWQNCNENQSSFKENIRRVFEAPVIYNTCLHPTKDTLCVQYRDYKKNANLKTACIKINTKENTEEFILLDKTIPLGSIFQFIENSDILFIGTPAPKKATTTLFQAPLQDDYFVNTHNGHMWSKEKNKGDERILGAKKTETDLCYERITLTSDCMQAIEQKAEGNALLDFCSIMLANGKESVDLSINRVAAAPLIDDTILKIIKNLNAVFMSLEEIAHMSQKVKDQSIQKTAQTTQAMRTALQTILGLGAFFLSFKLKSWELDKKNNPKEYASTMNKNYHGHDITKIVASCIFGTFLLFFLNQIAAQY